MKQVATEPPCITQFE